jgi:Tfp pilus assembly pilus retraction ATPase PilT
MAGMYCMRDLLELLLQQGAEELHLLADRMPIMLRGGRPVGIDVPELAPDDISQLLRSVSTEAQLQELGDCGDIRFIYLFQGSARFAIAAKVENQQLGVKVRNLNK